MTVGWRPGDSRIIITGVASRGCVQCAVAGFGIRDYYIYMPMDCTAAKNESETLLSFSLYQGFGYRYNVTVTDSNMISFRPCIESTAKAGDSIDAAVPA